MASSHSDVLVVGGGIAGVTSAYLLARAGVSVCLLEKGRIANSQSGRNWGFIRRQGCDPSEVPLVQYSSETWALIVDEVGPATTVKREGLVSLATSPERLETFRVWLEASNASSVFGTVLIGPDEAREIVPFVAGDWAGGLYTPTDGHADPGIATRAIGDAAAGRGVDVREGVTAHALSLEGDRVVGVETPGGRIMADSVIIAGGVWSQRLLRSAGIDLPVRLIRATAGRTHPVAPVTDLAVATPDVGFSQTPDGSLIFGTAVWSDYDITLDTLSNLRMFVPNFVRNRKMIRLHLNSMIFEDMGRRIRPPDNPYDWGRIDDPPPNEVKIGKAFQSLQTALPGVDGVRMATSWAGTVDVTPDALPVAGGVSGVDGLYLATGLSSHGFGVGPGVARATVDLLLGTAPGVDLTEFSIDRFASGAGIKRHDHL